MILTSSPFRGSIRHGTLVAPSRADNHWVGAGHSANRPRLRRSSIERNVERDISMKAVLSCAGIFLVEGLSRFQSLGEGSSLVQTIGTGVAIVGGIVAINQCAGSLFWRLTDAYDA